MIGDLHSAGGLMRELLERNVFGIEVDEGLARRDLRRQIGQLEHELSGLVAEGFGRVEIESGVAAGAAGPRVLGLGELERVRDELADRVAEARTALAERARVESDNRELLRRMLADPRRFKWLRVHRADVGEPGCGAWHSLPVLGPVGMLMGWWRVKVSSGCPLAGRLAAVDHEGQSQARLQSRREAAGALG
ncbi:MAG TPA: hypothetical protein VFS26_07795 [Solirubrobacterales bacterium]|nr:hypothetical protein [Solirubrobacterales bacterium]